VSVQASLEQVVSQVDARLSHLLDASAQIQQAPAKLAEAMRYSALAPGKRLRPMMCMESERAVGGHSDAALDAGCAIEFVHAFSLIHDDLPAIDNDDLRRGRPTCHIAYGEAVAILAGDGLFSLAFEVLAASSGSLGARPVAELARAASSLVSGETLDILSEGEPADAIRLAKIHEQKTGALFACSCVLGGLFGGGTDTEVEALRTYGYAVGLAFQIADDILNETATAEQLGKAAGSDRDKSKMTYPSLYGLDESKRLALATRDKALDSLDKLSGQRDALAELATFAIERVK
jgi:geranylgeranyl diphosphate synthase, type II